MPTPTQTLAQALAQRAQGMGRAPGPGGAGVMFAHPPAAPRELSASHPPERVVYPLGSLYQHVAPLDQTQIFTFEDSKLPNENMYDPSISPVRPYTFDVARYQVPSHMVLLVLGYEFSASRVGGVDAYDTQLLEPGRMRQSWLWDVNVAGTRAQRQTSFQIVPTPVVQAGAGNGLPQDVERNAFASTAAKQAQAIGGAGLAALPFDGREYGSARAPFSLRVDQGQTVAVRCSIIRPLSVPLAAITARLDGFLFPVTLLDAYEDLIGI